MSGKSEAANPNVRRMRLRVFSVLSGSTSRRRFLTKQEKIKRLEEYAEELKKENAAVEDKIKEMKS